jgi:hypothetical protein
MKNIIEWFKGQYQEWKRKKNVKKKIKQMQKNDPFVYKH